MADFATTLEKHASETIDRAKQNRGQTLTGGGDGNVTLGTEQKWANNLLDAIPPHVLPSVAGWRRAWRESDVKEKWSSAAKSGSTANALTTAMDFINDVLFSTGNVPFRIGLVNERGQNLSMPAQDQAMLEEKLEKHLDSRHAKCASVQQLMNGVWSSGMYGPRIFHCYLAEDKNEPSGMRPAFEATNIWEDFWDMDNTTGNLEDGEYFLRSMRRSRRFMRNWARNVNRTSQKEHGGLEINLRALEDSFRDGFGGGVGVNNTSNQKGTPETDDLIWQTNTEVQDELWTWMPKSAVLEYIAGNPGSIPYIHPDAVEVLDAEGKRIGWSNPPMEGDQDENEQVWVLIHLNNDKVIGLLPEPGSLTYRMGEWHRMPGCRDALGICDRNATNQATMDGLTRALENDIRHARTVLAYKAGSLVNGKKIEDLLSKPLAYLELDPGLAGAIEGVFKSFNLETNAAVFIEAIKFYQQLADMDTGIPRIQQGNSSEGANTAFELKQRLDNSGRHIGGKIRGLDEDIVWINTWMLQMDVELGNIELPSDVEIKGGGFRKFSKQLMASSTLMAMMQLAKQFPEVNDRMNVSWVLAEYAEAQGQDPEKYWISEPEYQQKLQQRQNSPQAQQQLQATQVALEKVQAATAKDNALAQKALADAQMALAKVDMSQGQLQLDRAKGAVDIANKMRDHNTRMDRRSAMMEPSRVVKMKRARTKQPA